MGTRGRRGMTRKKEGRKKGGREELEGGGRRGKRRKRRKNRVGGREQGREGKERK